jgi:secondary thiamine-phosphate synthase enzyme
MESGLRRHRFSCVTRTPSAPGFVDLTRDIEKELDRSGISDGRVTVFSRDEGCSLIVQERESGLLIDIEQTLHRLSAMRKTDPRRLIGSSSVVLPAVRGRLQLGTWQRVLLVETDAPGARAVLIHIVGR